jgi:hypothetical protein
MTDEPEAPPLPRDPEFLREHREALLSRQDLTADAFSSAVFGNTTTRDLIVAVIYSAAALGLSSWVVWVGMAVGHGLIAVALVAPVAIFVLQFWSNFIVSRRNALRGRAYEGVLERKDDAAIFAGGRVSLPPRILNELVPGVRYRIHAAGTDEVAVDVAIDDEEKKRGAYR